MDFEGNEKRRVLHFRRTWIKKSMLLSTDCSVADRGRGRVLPHREMQNTGRQFAVFGSVLLALALSSPEMPKPSIPDVARNYVVW